MHDPIATRIFSAADQRSFASLSGDWNPMHMDPIAARRTQAGAPVVHGVHAALWALDRLFATGILTVEPTSLEVRFEKFLYIDAEVRLTVKRKTNNTLYAELWADDLMTTAIKIGLAASTSASTQALDVPPLSNTLEPKSLALSDLAEAGGRLPVGESDAAKSSFPHVIEYLGAARTATIAQLSTIVGMHCPGLHSIFSSFTIQLFPDVPGDGGLRFRTRSVDERFNMVEIDVSAQGFSGTITAFLRQAPVAPPSMTELASLGLVSSQAFSGITALIVGGSRGLGALTAKLIASGGGRVVITYCVGEAEALAIADDIGSHACRALRYDACKDALPQLADLDWNINQLYYFATTHIFRQKAARYSPAHFAAFCDIYINGFEAICTALRTLGGAGLAAFYPSSSAVDERPRGMTEYSMAKAAGELLCADMNRYISDIRIIVKRLPRLLTDQTAVIVPTENADPVRTMLPIIQDLRQHTEAITVAL